MSAKVKEELSFSEGEKTRNALVADYDFDDNQAAGIVTATNEAAKTVLDEMKRFEERVNAQFKEFRSDVDKRFDEVDQRFDKVEQQIADVRSDFRMQKWTLWATFAGVVLTCVVTLFAGA